MPTYSDNKGNRFTTLQIEAKMRKSKETILELQFLEYGYNFCTKCHRNDCKPIDVSHNISVKKAKETGNAQLCWDLDNLEILGRKCHAKKDKLNIQWR